MFVYKTRGVCSRAIALEIENGVITACQFEGGCNGNTKGVASLVVDMKVDDAIARLKGITCGPRPTSCPDQLATALEQYKAENA